MVEDYVLGLKAALYLMVHEPTRTWNGQSMPTIRHQKGKPVHPFGAELPNFGKYVEKKLELIAEHKRNKGPIGGNVEPMPSESVNGFNPNNQSIEPITNGHHNGSTDVLSRVPTVAQLVGSSLTKIVNYTELDPVKQVVASIDKVSRSLLFCVRNQS